MIEVDRTLCPCRHRAVSVGLTRQTATVFAWAVPTAPSRRNRAARAILASSWAIVGRPDSHLAPDRGHLDAGRVVQVRPPDELSGIGEDAASVAGPHRRRG